MRRGPLELHRRPRAAPVAESEDAVLLRFDNPGAAELLATTAVIFVVLLPIVPALAVERLLAPNSSSTKAAKVIDSPCTIRPASREVAKLPPGGMLAPLDMGPNLLINTDRAVLATGHHRGARAMRLTIDAFSGSPDQALAIMRANDLRYLAICPALPELAHYRKRGPKGFAAQLGARQVPKWLEPIPMPARSGMRLWRRVD